MKKFLILVLALSVNANAYIMGVPDCKPGSGDDPGECTLYTTFSLPTLVVSKNGSALLGQEAADRLYNEARGDVPALNLEGIAKHNNISVDELKNRIIREYEGR